jgi:ATP-binding cassette, subfamily B, bacterial PglK
MSFIRKILSLLDRQSRLKVWVLLTGMILCSLLEAIGLSGIPLYINTVFNGEISTGLMGERIADLKAWSGGSFILMFSVAVLGFYLLKNAYYYLLNYQIHRFIARYKTSLETVLVNKFVLAPYLQQIGNNSSYYLRTVRDADLFINKVLLPSINSILDALIVISIVSVLMFQLPLALIGLLVMVVSTSFVLIALLRRKMKSLGGREMNFRQEVLKVLNETFMLNKEIHVYVNYSFFSNRFRKVTSALNKTVFQHGRLNIAIKPLMEVISILALVVIVLYFVANPQESVMGFLALLAVALVKMLPSLQTLTTSINSIQYNSPVLDNIHTLLREDKPQEYLLEKTHEKIPFRSIVFEGVTFRYPGKIKPALTNLNLNIQQNQVVGVIGISGAGKSTFMDLVLGLIHPSEGRVMIDQQQMMDAGDAWRNNIGYVPQTLNLLDDTIQSNILFGREYDAEKMNYALQFSGVISFIDKLEKGLETSVGERGIKVSGGQRQRIGIARALYNQPGLLIFDEATSSLDSESEQLITDTIYTLKGNITVLIISHRYDMLQHCDQILELRDGVLASVFSYQELITTVK